MRRQLTDGLYIFNKPVGISSAGFLNQIKKRYVISKIGHGGTLDPFASGVLVVGVGRPYTKQLSEMLTHATKEYEAVILLGASSSTDDCTGDIEKNACVAPPTRQAVERACRELQKREWQLPPRFSAIKIDGVPAYAHARRGNDVPLEPKRVVIGDYCVNGVYKKNEELTEVDVGLTVSSGFYVRSFARDLGELLGVGGYVSALTRTRAGDFCLEQALETRDLDGVFEARAFWHGRVQGIGFRDFVRTAGNHCGVAGWVKNLPDRSVEGIAQGTMAQLDAFLKSVATEHAYARIERCQTVFTKIIKNEVSFSVV